MVMFIRDAILTLFPLNVQICPGDAGGYHQSEGQPLTSNNFKNQVPVVGRSYGIVSPCVSHRYTAT
jgi:hypothetical protein